MLQNANLSSRIAARPTLVRITDISDEENARESKLSKIQLPSTKYIHSGDECLSDTEENQENLSSSSSEESSEEEEEQPWIAIGNPFFLQDDGPNMAQRSARFQNDHIGQDGVLKCPFCENSWHPLRHCRVYRRFKKQ